MSLSSKIVVRNALDLINEGLKHTLTGSTGGSVTDSVLIAANSERAVIVTGFSLTVASGTPEVKLGFKKGSDPTLDFFEGIVSAGGPVSRDYRPESWHRSDLDYALVITSDADVTFTIETKITSFPAALGFIERWGAQSATAHPGRAVFANESGDARGQSEGF
jgi:hypothetical protein